MKNDLSCGVARDLMPLYAENLAGEESRAALERHIAQCPDCAEALAAMTAPEETPEIPLREVDYLKAVRRKTLRRVVLAVICTVLVLACAWAAGAYVIGAPADRTVRSMSFSVHTHPAEETIDLRVLTAEGQPAYWGWEVTRQGEVVDISARQGRPSPLHPRQEFFSTIDVAGVREVYLCGQLLWQDGVTLLPGAQSVYDCRTPYVGNASALGRLAQAMVRTGRLPDGFTMELQTAREPHGWTLVYDVPGDTAQLDRELEAAAPLLLALVENLGEFSWSRPGTDGETVVRTVTLEEADAAYGSSVKACAQSPAAFQQLCNWAAEL